MYWSIYDNPENNADTGVTRIVSSIIDECAIYCIPLPA